MAIVVSGCAVQASKPRPVNRVSDGERVLLGVRLLSEVVRSLLAKVRASARPDGVVTSAVASSKRTDDGDLAGAGGVVARGDDDADRAVVGGDDAVRG